MPNDPPKNDPLGLYDDDPVLHPPDTRSKEKRELDKDLSGYDNPESFSDTTTAGLTHNLRIVSTGIERLPTVLSLAVHRDILIEVAQQILFDWTERSPETLKGFMEDFGVETWEEVRVKLAQDNDFQYSVSQSYWFFVRNFPKLMVRLYEIAVATSAVSIYRTELLSEQERRNLEPGIKKALELGINQLRKDIKLMLKTRTGGRPTKIHPGPFPENVRRVLLTARGLMKGDTGRDAVPALKTVALALEMSETALRKHLVRSGHPWRLIKIHLETTD